MAFYQLIKTQELPASISEIWDFISAPVNLKEITPEHMGFLVTSNNGHEKMYPGMIISYKVSPAFGIKLNWMTEITHVKDFEYFVDEQRIGPYFMCKKLSRPGKTLHIWLVILVSLYNSSWLILNELYST
ncbi:MAG: hypothetical protein U5L72_09275 [Bacteroidales bacterium]|nr:hypothetical protein [Bacteroidales bacterium]